jgi:predicted transcriptional regulator
MSSVKINESPNHFMVLDAIGRGVKTIDKIAKVTRLDKAQVELIVNDLIVQRLVIRTEKKGFLGRTKVELTISHTGLQVLNVKKQELEKQWQQVQQWYNNGQTQQVQGYMDNNRMWIPMMLFSGIMNTMFFMSMMSMMGMALSPAENGLVGGDAGAGAAADSGDASGADDGSAGADSGGADSGGAADFGSGGDFGGGDFSF